MVWIVELEAKGMMIIPLHQPSINDSPLYDLAAYTACDKVNHSALSLGIEDGPVTSIAIGIKVGNH